MNPKETIEIQRQFDELMAKDLVRESLSPCAVPPTSPKERWLNEDVCG